MPRTTRSNNLDLLRHIQGGHTPLAKRLKSTTNSAYLSRMATGRRAISNTQAKQIEELLEPPKGWMDRKHAAMHQMSPLQYDLWLEVASLSEERQQALLLLLKAPTTKVQG